MDQSLRRFWSQTCPFSWFWDVRGAAKAHITLKIGSFHFFVHPKRSTIPLGKTHLRPIFDPFLVPKWPLLKAFRIFRGPKRVTTGSKRAKTTCFSHPSSVTTSLRKISLFAAGTMVGPPPPLCTAHAALGLQKVTAGTGVWACRRAILRVGNPKKWGFAGGLGALGIWV